MKDHLKLATIAAAIVVCVSVFAYVIAMLFEASELWAAAAVSITVLTLGWAIFRTEI